MKLTILKFSNIHKAVTLNMYERDYKESFSGFLPS